jgi:hypothetical protein
MPVCPACPAKVDPNATDCVACGASFLKPDLGILESRLTPQQEAAAQVPGFLPISLGLLGVGGATLGLFGIATAFAKGWPGLIAALLVGLAGSIFLLGAYAGVCAIRRSPGWLRTNTVFWGLQVPVFMSPVASYALANGAFVTVWVQFLPFAKVGTNFMLGSSFNVNMFHKGPVMFGVNIVAASIAFYLHRVQVRSAA